MGLGISRAKQSPSLWRRLIFRSSSSPFTGTLPSRAALKTNLKYDNSLLEHFQNSHAKTKEFLNQVVALARVRLSHASIIMKVDIKIGEVDHLNEYIKANDYSFDNLVYKVLYTYNLLLSRVYIPCVILYSSARELLI